MIEFKVNGKFGKKVLNIPSSLDDIHADWLKNITKHIKINDDYSLVAICQHHKLSSIILAARQKKNEITAGIIPLFVKGGKTTSDFFKDIKVGCKLIVSGSDLALGNHVVVPGNVMTIDTVLDYCEGDGYAYQNALKLNSDCWFVQFKLVPNCNIKGWYDVAEPADKDQYIKDYNVDLEV